jgi:hypothetical protein
MDIIDKPLVERRKREDRRKVATMVSPEVERRKFIRRKRDAEKRAQLEQAKRSTDKRNFMVGMICLTIAGSFLGYYLINIFAIFIKWL